MFPCKPDREERQQPGPGGRPLSLHTLSCESRGWQFSLTWTDLGDASAVPLALQRMKDGIARQLTLQSAAPLTIQRMTPDPSAVQQRLRTPAGQPAQQIRQAVFASRGHVYQLLMQGRAEAPLAGGSTPPPDTPASGGAADAGIGHSPAASATRSAMVRGTAGKAAPNEADEAWEVWLGSIRLPG